VTLSFLRGEEKERGGEGAASTCILEKEKMNSFNAEARWRKRLRLRAQKSGERMQWGRRAALREERKEGVIRENNWEGKEADRDRDLPRREIVA